MPKLISPNSNTNLLPIGLNLPIQRGQNGYFEVNYDTISQVKANIINLLKTKRGERRFQPLFGSGLQEILFEQISDATQIIIEQTIKSDINNWIPNVTVNSVNFSLDGYDNNQLKDNYTIYIKVTFTVNNITDNVDLVLQQNNI
jgi:phage baseplate assembly protein W